MNAYRECPICGAEKAFREEGQREYDTNTYPELVVDESMSCVCDLTADQGEELTDTITTEDFIDDGDY